MPESPRRVGQRANQGRWRGVAVSQGGESRNGGRGPGERGWGRSALRGVWLCGIHGGGPREETPCGEGRLVGLSVAEGDHTRPGEQQVPAGGPRCEAPGPAAPPPPHPLPRASRGRGGLGGAPSAADRQWPGERSARGGLLLYTPLPREEVSWRSPRRLGGAGESVRLRKCPHPGLALALTRYVTLGKSLPSQGLSFPTCKTNALQAVVHELDLRCSRRSLASCSPGGALVSRVGP